MIKHFGRDMILLMSSLLVWALGEGLWYNLRQLYLTQMGASPMQVGIAIALETITRAVLMLPAGYAVDRFGSRQVLIGAWVFGVLGIGAMIAAPNWQWYIAALMFYGLSAFVIPAISAYALQAAVLHNPHFRSEQVLPTLFAAYPAGLILSPALGGWLAGQYGIMACFWAALGLSVLSTGILLATTHFDPHDRVTRFDLRPLLSNRAFMLRIGFLSSAAFSLYVGFQLVPNYLQEVRGLPIEQIGLMFSIFSVGTMLANLAGGQMRLRWSYPLTMLVVLAAQIVIWQSGSRPVLMAAMGLMGGVYATRSLASSAIAQVVKAGERGMAFSFYEVGNALAMSIASMVAGRLYEGTPLHDGPFMASIVLIPLIVGGWFVLRLWGDEAASDQLSAIS
jgi:MFS family permease